MCEDTKKVVASMMCADIVINQAKYDPVLESYRKVCKYMSSKLGASPMDLSPMLKQKLDALTDKTFGKNHLAI